MAHVVVYLQRTPSGLHPGSLAGLCVARDIGDSAGAAVTAICEGDAKSHDDALIAKASACGADELFFVGPSGLEAVCSRLRPAHFFVPCTVEGERAAERAGLGPPATLWIETPPLDHSRLPRVASIVSGMLPWQSAPMLIDPEYEGDVAEVVLPSWVAQGASVRSGAGSTPVHYVAPQDLDAITGAALRSLGATPVAPDYAAQHREGVLLWLDAGPNGLPAALEGRPAAARVVLLVGPNGRPHPSWRLADWVLGGPWTDAVRDLQGSPWRAALG